MAMSSRSAVALWLVLSLHQLQVSAEPLRVGWQRITIPGVGTIDAPPVMEVQNEAIGRLNPYGGSKRRGLTLQQAGLNKFDSDAAKLYFRLMIETELVDAGSVEALGTAISLDRQESRDLSDAFREGLPAKFKKTVLQVYAPKVVRLGQIPAVRMGYKRKGLHGPVIVWKYLVQNYDRMHHLTVSYRESESSIWRKYLAGVLSSLRITNVRRPAYHKGSDEPTYRPGGTSQQPVGSASSDALPTPFTSDWVALMLISALITWSVGLAPPLFIRFFLLKRPLSNWAAITICALFLFGNLWLFTAMGSKSKTHSALLFVAMASYCILRTGWRRYQQATEIGEIRGKS